MGFKILGGRSRTFTDGSLGDRCSRHRARGAADWAERNKRRGTRGLYAVSPAQAQSNQGRSHPSARSVLSQGRAEAKENKVRIVPNALTYSLIVFDTPQEFQSNKSPCPHQYTNKYLYELVTVVWTALPAFLGTLSLLTLRGLSPTIFE